MSGSASTPVISDAAAFLDDVYVLSGISSVGLESPKVMAVAQSNAVRCSSGCWSGGAGNPAEMRALRAHHAWIKILKYDAAAWFVMPI